MLPIIPIALPTGWASVGPAFAYLIRQEPITLVDAGLGTPDSKQALLEALATLDLPLTAIKRVIATHAHVDHIGLAGWIQAETGAELWIHPLEVGKLHRTDWWQAGRDRFLLESGLPTSFVERFGPTYDRRLRKAVTPFQEWHFLREGDQIPFEGGQLAVIQTPGHALGHISLLEEATGRLIGGDILLEGQTPNPLAEALPQERSLPALSESAPEWSRLMPVPYAPYRSLTVAQFGHTLERLGALPIQEVFPGHGPRILDVPKLIATYTGRRKRKLERILGHLTEPRTALELMHELFPRLGEADLHLGLSDIVGHLDILYVNGAVTVEPAADGLRYRAH